MLPLLLGVKATRGRRLHLFRLPPSRENLSIRRILLPPTPSCLMSQLEKPEAAADTVMPTAPISATPIAPTSIGPGPIPTDVAPPSQFEVGSNSAIVPNPISEVAALFIRFD
ncbi:uncharacterized protein LOC115988855 [Quercus lobata]|uniref:uncharacterized protein LOC115988855 n=1 Tax=Quercus lobata TaxID=97700 RepID=UPI00124486C1|nr:uncharacterized protein LOC115988855 [Quercus lobata]